MDPQYRQFLQETFHTENPATILLHAEFEFEYLRKKLELVSNILKDESGLATAEQRLRLSAMFLAMDLYNSTNDVKKAEEASTAG